MARYILILIGIVGSFFLIKFRETIGDLIGEAEWMKRVGGVYNLVIIVAVLIFFWSIAELTGTTSILFGPLRYLHPAFQQQALPPGI